jgi:hypothetical protein
LVLHSNTAKIVVRVGSCDCGDDGSTKKGAGARYPTRPSPAAGAPSLQFRWHAGPNSELHTFPPIRQFPTNFAMKIPATDGGERASHVVGHWQSAKGPSKRQG